VRACCSGTGRKMPRFIADEMLGSLARWLRIVGQDTLYVRDMDDDDIVSLGKREGRVVLTRDKELASRMGDLGALIRSDELMEQMAQVVGEFQIEMEGESRCTVCNGPLEKVGKEEVADRVPERSLERNSHFYRCTVCGKVYWKGSHWDDIYERMERIREISGGSSSR
jgi:uncharacterized protein with PIN domain